MRALLITLLTAMAVTATIPSLAAAQPAPGTGPDVTRWDGATHRAYFGSPTEWARFQLVVTADEFREIRQATEAETEARLEEGYLVLTGCLVRACSTTRAGLAVEVATGKAMAAVWQRDRKPKVFGAKLDGLPVSLQKLATEGSLP
ncbi:MAG: hypothetical protein AAF568_00030 [Pseudomonadota bacterium]